MLLYLTGKDSPVKKTLILGAISLAIAGAAQAQWKVTDSHADYKFAEGGRCEFGAYAGKGSDKPNLAHMVVVDGKVLSCLGKGDAAKWVAINVAGDACPNLTGTMAADKGGERLVCSGIGENAKWVNPRDHDVTAAR